MSRNFVMVRNVMRVPATNWISYSRSKPIRIRLLDDIVATVKNSGVHQLYRHIRLSKTCSPALPRKIDDRRVHFLGYLSLWRVTRKVTRKNAQRGPEDVF